MVTFYKDKEGTEKKDKDESYPIFSEFKKYIYYSDTYVKIPSILNVKEKMHCFINIKKIYIITIL